MNLRFKYGWYHCWGQYWQFHSRQGDDLKTNHNSGICEKLIISHHNSRKHLLQLMADVSESQWNLVPENSAWSLQTTAAEILNYEIKTLNKFTDLSIKEVSEEFTHHEFVVAQTKNTNHLVNELRKENESQGFIYHDKNSIKPSLHWIMIRTIQHSIYHSGGISVLRHLVGLQRGSYDHWEPMVDSVFLAGISLE